ncbi:probable myosin-binding protein 5 isoform X2 [Olea europaea var. sylvestris]|uniref:probable myosin-binding protein 5 isoform X2 n=1 Tax=Olea europaea var. sylvestris TaxID=158386 RepID=UPI000C1D0C52|nr:probable myosin-binding protein 5 isoform X2 [Olea europaea var. sylvestris]
MRAKSFNGFIEERLGKFPHFVIYAILEWVMIILLFIDGFLAFVSNEYAKFFELRIPCLLCTRIDHVLVRRHSSFDYNDSICPVHKKDISSLAYCHVHKRLSDIRSTCEVCLLSYATEKDSDCEQYKSLVGILHKDIDLFVGDNPRTGKKDETKHLDDKGGIRRCCCNEPLKIRPSYKYNRSLSINAPTPSPRVSLLRNEDGRNIELPHVRYSELRFTSDAESELPEEYAPNGDDQSRECGKAAVVSLLPDYEDYEDFCKTRSFVRGGNKFFGISLSDSTQASPKWANNGARKQLVDNFSELNVANVHNETDRNILSCLKRQVRLDRKSLIELYMELDEERSASAIAANNAMAMITRLQAEKATVQMEALQYQRVMEEEAEYDQEAMQVMKDLLLKREEEIKVLESELEAYREKYGHIKKVGRGSVEADADENYQEIKSQSSSSFGEKSDCGSSSGENERPYDRSMEYGEGISDELQLDFENERSYLLGLLAELEKKINAPLDERSDILEVDALEHEDGTKVTLQREVSTIRERLRAIEADSGFLKYTAMTLQRGGEATKLLIEIAQHLRKLRHSNKTSLDDINA